jgi:hypothetical protein
MRFLLELLSAALGQALLHQPRQAAQDRPPLVGRPPLPQRCWR